MIAMWRWNFFCFVFLQWIIEDVVTTPQNIDFAPFRKAVAQVLKHPTNPILDNSTNADCVFPDNAVMFTYSSHYMTDLILIQQRALNSSGIGHCLRSRFITLCLDIECHDFCQTHHILHCPLINLNKLPASDFNKGEYRFFTFLKHELLLEALKVASHAFFFDADCIIMKNPFVELSHGGRDKEGRSLPGIYDMFYQRDRGRGNDCSGSINSGQIYLRNSTKVQHYLQVMLSFKDIIMEGKNGLDQDFISNATDQANLTKCSLAPTLYTAHCLMIFGNINYINRNAPVKDLVTYHTSCAEGVGSKKGMLLRVLNAVESKNHGGIGGFVRI